MDLYSAKQKKKRLIKVFSFAFFLSENPLKTVDILNKKGTKVPINREAILGDLGYKNNSNYSWEKPSDELSNTREKTLCDWQE